MNGHSVRTIGAITIDGNGVTRSQRPLVAALALSRDTGATIEFLVDAVWPHQPPNTAKNSVQNQIARLRHTFGRDLIVTANDRYQLIATTDIDTIDRAAATCTRSHLTPPEVHAIADVLDGWNGEPYADLGDHPKAQAERARLHHVQSRLVETLAVSRLMDPAGDHDAAIIDLTVRTSTDPLHEQAWELLVTALHLSGRRTEALGAFTRFADILHQQIGAAPSRRFQQLRGVVAADHPIDPMDVLSPTGVISPLPLRATA
jgi:DNA-binding SARP family transcriptional activator